jgi:AcrR family transcriptional regulator
MTLDPTRPRDAVIAAGRERLLAHGIDALRSQLNASALSADSPVSRDTAYRVFRGESTGSGESVTDAIVAAVAGAVNDTTWGGSDAALAAVIEAYQASVDGGGDALDHVTASLQAGFEAQFRSPGLPAGWLLLAAAMTASPAWQGQRPGPEDEAVGRALLQTRRQLYHDLTEQLMGLVNVTMSEFGRRTRHGLAPRDVVLVVHCLLDGAVVRRLIEPEAMPPELFAGIIRLLWDAATEQGSFDDPRRPEDERSQRVFDRLVAAAGELWAERPDAGVDDVAERAGVAPEAATLLFPDLGDLADSLLRSRVVAGGFADLGPAPEAGPARLHLPMLVSQLQRLRDLADTLPGALAVARTHPPTRSKPFADDFVGNEGRIVGALGVTPNPDQLVADLLAFAGQGTPGWASVMALMRTLGYVSGA